MQNNDQHKYFLTFALMAPLDSLIKQQGNDNDCPLDNDLIENQYISDKGMYNYSEVQQETMRQFKCCSLHSIINGKDITEYSYSPIGYDLDPKSMQIYLGGWGDVNSTTKANFLSNDKETLSLKKIGKVYLDPNNIIADKMHNKVVNRAQLLLDVVKKIENGTKLEDVKQEIFESSNKTLDDSFDKKSYQITLAKDKDNNDILALDSTLKIAAAIVKKNRKRYGFTCNMPFSLSYNLQTKQLSMVSPELNGVAIDQAKGIKVDRIFITKEKLEELKKQQTSKEPVYNTYINKLTDVFIEQFPFGDIRIIDKQDFQLLKPEEFINQYFIDEQDKQAYLKKLATKRLQAQSMAEEHKTINNKEIKKIDTNNQNYGANI